MQQLCEFEGRIYGQRDGQLFVLESDWDTFRPIERVGWNGTSMVTVDPPGTRDIFSPHFGFGSAEMRRTCDALLRTTDLETRKVLTDPLEFWAWCGHLGESTWVRDRHILLTPSCVGPGWKAYLVHAQSKPRTLRRHKEARRITRRLRQRTV